LNINLVLELSLVDKSSSGSNDNEIDGFVASSKVLPAHLNIFLFCLFSFFFSSAQINIYKVKFELEQKIAQFKSVDELVKQHTWRTFNNQIVPQTLTAGWLIT
jgi:hypothetical protein